MAVDDVIHLLRSCCHVCLMLSFSHAIGQLLPRDVNREFPSVFPAHAPPSYEVTQKAAVLRPGAVSDDVIKTAANATNRPPRWRRKAAEEVSNRWRASSGGAETAAWSRELAAGTLQELEQELSDARVNCSRSTTMDVQSLKVGSVHRGREWG